MGKSGEEVWITAIVVLLVGGIWHYFASKTGAALGRAISKRRLKRLQRRRAKSADHMLSTNEPIKPE